MQPEQLSEPPPAGSARPFRHLPGGDSVAILAAASDLHELDLRVVGFLLSGYLRLDAAQKEALGLPPPALADFLERFADAVDRHEQAWGTADTGMRLQKPLDDPHLEEAVRRAGARARRSSFRSAADLVLKAGILGALLWAGALELEGRRAARAEAVAIEHLKTETESLRRALGDLQADFLFTADAHSRALDRLITEQRGETR